jgi:hypothetical protein
MISELEIKTKLLQLTRTKTRIPMEELHKELPLPRERLHIFLTELSDGGILHFNDGLIEQDSIQRLTLAEELIRKGRDPELVSRLLLWQEFEEFIETALDRNEYCARKHIVFKSSLGKREIDILAWNNLWILVIDCKHWSRNLSHARLRAAAEAQAERARALAHRPDILMKRGVRRLDVPLIPVIISLSETRKHVIEGIPIVTVSRFASFLHEASPYDPSFKTFTVMQEPTQRSILSILSNQTHNRSPNLAPGRDRREP